MSETLESAVFMLYVWIMLWHLEAEVRNCIKICGLTGYMPPSYSLFWTFLLAGFLIQYPDSSTNLSLFQP